MQWGSFVTVSKAYNAVLLLEYQTWYCPLITVQQAATEMIGYNNLQLNNFNITLGYGDESERTGLYLCLGICSGVYLLGRTITYPVSISTLYSIVAIDSASGMDAVQVCDVNTANNTSAIIFQMRLTKGDILPDNMTGFYWILIGKA